MKKYAICLLLLILFAPGVQAGTVPYEVLSSQTTETGNYRSWRVRWAGIENGDTCQEFPEAATFTVKSVQVDGTWAGATVAIKGRATTDLTAQVLRAHPSGVLLNFTDNDTALISENFRYLTPVISGGGPTTSISVVVELSN